MKQKANQRLQASERLAARVPKQALEEAVCLLQHQQCEHRRHQRKREADAELDCLPLMKVLQVSFT